MKPPSLRNRIRNGSLAMLGIALGFSAAVLPQVHRLGSAIRETLYRNYISIDASQHMNQALWRLQLAMRDGSAAAVLPASREEFTRYINIEKQDITEAGESILADDIAKRGERLFSELASNPARNAPSQEFDELRRSLDRLIEINSDAMFRADSRSARLGTRVTYIFVGMLAILLVLGSILSWTLAWSISKPLNELAELLRGFSLRGPSVRLGEPRFAELQPVTWEFNKMAARLEEFEKLNVARLIYEKKKTEAMIENLESGIVVIDLGGMVTYVNGMAATILGVDQNGALASPFDDLNSNHPHYLGVRKALRSIVNQPVEEQRIEVDLHVRGRDHTYVLKPVPLKHTEGVSFGTILILQDITYLRDKDRSRINLVATLSHELKTPLTSLALSIELLERSKQNFDGKQHELLSSMVEDIARMRTLSDGLLNLARGEAGTIAVRSVLLNLCDLIASVAKTFALQFEQKQVSLTSNAKVIEARIRADPVKLSWVFSNLIANGLRYTPSGGNVSILTDVRDSKVRVKVADTGPGIPPQIRNYLFERYAQWTLNGVAAGSAGLGLAIVKEIVEAHGGRIFVESAPGKGTCFTIELPLPVEAACLSF